jgi:hypothetical protein
MTPAQEQALLNAAAADVDDEVRRAYERLIGLIRKGQDPRDAVKAVMDSFVGEYAQTMAAALSAVMAASVGTSAVLELEVGVVSLSRKLYAQTEQTSAVVAGVVDRHLKGFADARRVALELFEGYGFRDEEVLNMAPGNQALPQYLRNELLRFPELRKELEGLFREVYNTADELKTPALRASYLEYLDALQKGAGADVLDKKIEMAFYQKMRYFANRIVQTEAHRAFANRQAFELMDDADVEYVQWRLNPRHPRPDICDYFASVDKFGLGPGVYIKGQAPVAPAHPFCMCVLSPRLDLTGKKPKPREGAARALFARYGEQEAAQIAGSKAKLAQVMAGDDPMAVHNATVKPEYRVRTVQQVVTAPRGLVKA